jgi:hypothetical protein
MSDSVVELGDRTFGGADRIVLHLTRDRRVYSMAFFYPSGTSYQKTVESYVPLLGQPKRTDSGSYWEDDRTRFTIRRTVVDGAEVVSSLKADLALSRLMPPNMRLKLSARGGRLAGKGSILITAAAGRSLSAPR